MLDQSFSAENFRAILDLENRKGVHLEDKLSMTSIRRINEKIKECNQGIREKKKVNDFSSVNLLKEEKKKLREKKEVDLSEELEKISNIVSSKTFSVEMVKCKGPDGKYIYKVPRKPDQYFALKQVQRNISKLFNVKQENRSKIVDQVKLLLGDQFPKFIIRTDIKGFYESVPHESLLKIINDNNLLTPFSRKILRNILTSYKVLSGARGGVPRGIGVSAYLAELFMRDIDNEIRNARGVCYYARYVDDIIIIYTPESSPDDYNRNYLQEIKGVIEDKYKLKLNMSKTVSIDLRREKSSKVLEYLGYKFKFGDLPLVTLLSDNKVVRYKIKLKLAFDDYINYGKVNEKDARRLLVNRVRFLCTNTKLRNNKKNILVGIYYSNSQLSDISDLEKIDMSLASHIAGKIKSIHLQDRLKKYGFKKGFVDKVFSPFKPNELNEVKKVWGYMA